jgi:pSer/pThr/pTyr-binding forkhead associated (FHA) protein
MIECGGCGFRNSDALFFCKSCGMRLVSSDVLPDDAKQAGIADLRSVVERLVSARLVDAGPAPAAYLPARPSDEAHFRLVSINADGSDGEIHVMGAGPVDIGRTFGNLVIDDPFLASRHARIVATAGGRVLSALERRNGVYRRLRAPASLSNGDKILIGKQLLRFEVLPELERSVAASIENGQAVFGSRCRPSWGRLLQLTPAGTPRDVYHLGRGEVVIGREKTDLVFSDDELVSGRHAKLTLSGGQVVLEDLSSMNGTFLALREPTLLASGDVIRMGNEVFRFEDA